MDVSAENKDESMISAVTAAQKPPRPTLREMGVEPYGVEVDVFSCGVVLGQLLFNVSDEYVLDYPDSHSDSMHDYYVRLIDKQNEFLIEYDLLLRMTDTNPKTRMKIPEAMQHPFFTQDAEAARVLLDARKSEYESRKKGGMECFGCKRMLPQDCFSKNQLRKKGFRALGRRCLTCNQDTKETDAE